MPTDESKPNDAGRANPGDIVLPPSAATTSQNADVKTAGESAQATQQSSQPAVKLSESKVEGERQPPSAEKNASQHLKSGDVRKCNVGTFALIAGVAFICLCFVLQFSVLNELKTSLSGAQERGAATLGRIEKAIDGMASSVEHFKTSIDKAVSTSKPTTMNTLADLEVDKALEEQRMAATNADSLRQAAAEADKKAAAACEALERAKKSNAPPKEIEEASAEVAKSDLEAKKARREAGIADRLAASSAKSVDERKSRVGIMTEPALPVREELRINKVWDFQSGKSISGISGEIELAVGSEGIQVDLAYSSGALPPKSEIMLFLLGPDQAVPEELDDKTVHEFIDRSTAVSLAADDVGACGRESNNSRLVRKKALLRRIQVSDGSYTVVARVNQNGDPKFARMLTPVRFRRVKTVSASGHGTRAASSDVAVEPLEYRPAVRLTSWRVSRTAKAEQGEKDPQSPPLARISTDSRESANKALRAQRLTQLCGTDITDKRRSAFAGCSADGSGAVSAPLSLGVRPPNRDSMQFDQWFQLNAVVVRVAEATTDRLLEARQGRIVLRDAPFAVTVSNVHDGCRVWVILKGGSLPDDVFPLSGSGATRSAFVMPTLPSGIYPFLLQVECDGATFASAPLFSMSIEKPDFSMLAVAIPSATSGPQGSQAAVASTNCCKEVTSNSRFDARGDIDCHRVIESPAHFPRPGYDRHFVRYDVDGAVIYENMQFKLCDNGDYQVQFCVSTPETVQLRIQLLLKDSSECWHTLTLPTKTITLPLATDSGLSRDRQTAIHEVVFQGKAPHLARCAGSICAVRRRGTARFGSLPPTQTPRDPDSADRTADTSEPSDTSAGTDQ